MGKAEATTVPPKVESEMSRELEVVRNCTDYVLQEDVKWRREHFACWQTNRKYVIHSSPRSLAENEKNLSMDEVEEFPVVFKVRESLSWCTEGEFRFGVFDPSVSDSAEWPKQTPLMHWKEPAAPPCYGAYPRIGLMTKDGQQIGSSQNTRGCISRFYVFDAAGDLLYILWKPFCAEDSKFVIYDGKDKVPVGFIRKIVSKGWCSEGICDCFPENVVSASFPETSNMTERLLLLRELVMQGRRLEAESDDDD